MAIEPAVSVLLPVSDASPTMDATISSLSRQTFEDFEVVAVDDGSIDGSLEMLRRWERSDPRIRVLERSRRGLVPTLNEGLEACRSRLIARMDADDIAHPRRLELQVRLLREREDLGVVSCLVRHFPHHRVQQGFRLYDAWLNSLVDHSAMAVQRFVESPVCHPSAMFRRDIVLDAGGYRDCGWAEDYDLWLRLFERDVRFEKVPRVLLAWRDHRGRLTRKDPRYTTANFIRCKAHFFVQGPASRWKGPVVVWGTGPNGKKLARTMAGEGAEINSWIDIDPKKIGRTLAGAVVAGPGALPALRRQGAMVLAAVASRGARDLIRSRTAHEGFVEGCDFWCLM